MPDAANDKGGAGDADNLLDAANSAAKDTSKGAPDAAAAAAAAAAAKPALAFGYDDKALETIFGKPGDDGRPANVPEKYWNKDTKSVKADVVFNQLRWAEGKIGKPLEILGAPAEGTNYEIAVPKELAGKVEIDAEDPRVQALFEVARESDLNQAFISKVIERAATKVAAMSEANLKEEVGKLGKDGEQRLKDMGDFLTANLTAEQAAGVKAMLQSAAGFEALEALIAKAAPPKFATKEDQAASVNQQQSLREEWERKYFEKDANGQRRMATDPAFAKQVNELRDRVFGTARRDAQGRQVAA